MTKEEIIRNGKHLFEDQIDDLTPGWLEAIKGIMDEYAQQQAILFSEFIKLGQYSWDDGQNAWVGEIENEDNLILTTTELYDLFPSISETINKYDPNTN
jgi:hypothetical protein